MNISGHFSRFSRAENSSAGFDVRPGKVVKVFVSKIWNWTGRFGGLLPRDFTVNYGVFDIFYSWINSGLKWKLRERQKTQLVVSLQNGDGAI